MDATQPVEKLITVRHAARMLGIGRHVLYRAGEAGELPIYDAGGWPRVWLSDVAAWLERTRRVPRGGGMKHDSVAHLLGLLADRTEEETSR